MLQTCEVDVWLVSLESDAKHDPPNILSPDELNRAARFHLEADRARWIRARTALRTILANYTSIPPSEIQFAIGPHGKPTLAPHTGIEFNLSHAGIWAMIAVTQNVPVGIDIERIRTNVDIAALLQRIGVTDLPTETTALFLTWNRREAMTKAVGRALMETPAGNFGTSDLNAPEGYTAALALLEHTPRIHYRNIPVLPAGTPQASL